MRKGIKKYIKEVELIIPITADERQEFIKILEDNIISSGIEDYDKIVERFGKPNEIASTFIGNMNFDILIKELKKRNYMRKIFIIAAICIILVSLFEMYRLNQLYEEFSQNQPTQVETIIEED